MGRDPPRYPSRGPELFGPKKDFLLEGRVLDKGEWVATLLGTFLGLQDHKKVKFPSWVYLSLVVKGWMFYS